MGRTYFFFLYSCNTALYLLSLIWFWPNFGPLHYAKVPRYKRLRSGRPELHHEARTTYLRSTTLNPHDFWTNFGALKRFKIWEVLKPDSFLSKNKAILSNHFGGSVYHQEILKQRKYLINQWITNYDACRAATDFSWVCFKKHIFWRVFYLREGNQINSAYGRPLNLLKYMDNSPTTPPFTMVSYLHPCSGHCDY